MGDMGDIFNEMKKAKKQKHWKMRGINRATIKESGIPFADRNNGETMLLREAGKPKVDFFPSTGRWRVAGQSKTYRGGASAFLGWYAKQGEPS